MKQWSFVFSMLLSVVFVYGAYVLNTRNLQADTAPRSEVLALQTENLAAADTQQRSPSLEAIAERRAQDMVVNKYYSHESPSGEYFFDYFIEQGIAADTPSCENLLLLESGLTREEVDEEWRNSPSHNACLQAGHNSYGYAEKVFDEDLDLSIYVYIAATL